MDRAEPALDTADDLEPASLEDIRSGADLEAVRFVVHQKLNVAQEVSLEQVRRNVARGLLTFNAMRPRRCRGEDILSICGSAPSLMTTLGEIIGDVMACNAAILALAAKGVHLRYAMIWDASPEMVRYALDLPDTEWMIASRCHPDLVDRLLALGQKITLWHADGGEDGLAEALPDSSLLIPGANTAVPTSCMLAVAMGYADLHAFGVDSSFHDETHVGGSLRHEEEVIAMVEGCPQAFRTTLWMQEQANNWQKYMLPMLRAWGIEISVHGRGLLPYLHRQWMANNPKADESAYCYDLASAPASWDFSEWLIEAERDRISRGAPAPLRVAFAPGPNGGFRDDRLPWSPEQRQAFLDSTMRPLLGLIGAVEDPGASNGRQHHYYCFKELAERARKGEVLPRFKAPTDAVDAMRDRLRLQASDRLLVITLREAGHWPQRNSDLDAWTAFAHSRAAEGYRIVFVRDTEKAGEPIEGFRTIPDAAYDVIQRMALYSLAHCNLFVTNGPASLCLFGDAPFLMFKPIIAGWLGIGTAEWWAEKVGVPVGTQYPWSAPDQRIVWAPDTIEAIEAAWHERLSGKASRLSWDLDHCP